MLASRTVHGVMVINRRRTRRKQRQHKTSSFVLGPGLTLYIFLLLLRLLSSSALLTAFARGAEKNKSKKRFSYRSHRARVVRFFNAIRGGFALMPRLHSSHCIAFNEVPKLRIMRIQFPRRSRKSLQRG